MKKLFSLTLALGFALVTSKTLTITEQQEIQKKLDLVHLLTPIARLAPQVKLQLLLILLPRIQEKDSDQFFAMHKLNGTVQNATLLQQLLTTLKQTVQTNQTNHILQAHTIQQKIKALISTVLTAVTQRLKPEEQVGLILYLAYALPATVLQTAQLPNAVKSLLSQLKTQTSAFKETIQNKYAPHLKEEIAKHEQETINQTEVDTL